MSDEQIYELDASNDGYDMDSYENDWAYDVYIDTQIVSNL